MLTSPSACTGSSVATPTPFRSTLTHCPKPGLAVVPPLGRRGRSRAGRCSGLGGGSDSIGVQPGLLAERGEVEVDALASHEPILEGRDIGERHGKRAAARWHAQPVATAGSAQKAPDDDDVVTERQALIVGAQ